MHAHASTWNWPCRVHGSATLLQLSGSFHSSLNSDLTAGGAYVGNVLPAMKHAAEELRCLGVSGAEGAGPSLRQAARSANEVLRANDRTSQQISKLHADAMRVCFSTPGSFCLAQILELLSYHLSRLWHLSAQRPSSGKRRCLWPWCFYTPGHEQ